MQASKQKGAGGLLSVANRQNAAGSREMYIYRKRKKQTRTKRQKAGKVKKGQTGREGRQGKTMGRRGGEALPGEHQPEGRRGFRG